MSTADLLVKINALPAELQSEVGAFVDRLLERFRTSGPAKEPEKKSRPIGLMRGEIWMADDFDAPLEDFKNYM